MRTQIKAEAILEWLEKVNSNLSPLEKEIYNIDLTHWVNTAKEARQRREHKKISKLESECLPKVTFTNQGLK